MVAATKVNLAQTQSLVREAWSSSLDSEGELVNRQKDLLLVGVQIHLKSLCRCVVASVPWHSTPIVTSDLLRGFHLHSRGLQGHGSRGIITTFKNLDLPFTNTDL